MNSEVKTKWVAALRSGNYKQGRGGLHRDGSFCCLGVLCDVQGLEKDLDRGFVYGDDVNNAYLHEQLARDLKLVSTDPYVPLSRESCKALGKFADNYAFDSVVRLATLNDDGVPFSVIADLIEKYL